MSSPATDEEIREIAQRAVEIFVDYGYNCCLFGSIGCALYGISRRPNDVDLIVLTDKDPEDLKQILVDEDSDFFLVPPKYSANYKFLWYSLSSSRSRSRRKCKVDILTPGGKLNLPRVPSRHIKRKQQLPVMEILPLLLTKLRGWTDHRDVHKWKKLRNDVKDINELLPITCRTRTHINSNSLRWLRKGFADFVIAAHGRIYEYVEEHPDSAGYWKRLGFDAHA